MSSRARPARPKEPGNEPGQAAGGDLAGRWLSKFLTSHLVSAYDLTWRFAYDLMCRS